MFTADSMTATRRAQASQRLGCDVGHALQPSVGHPQFAAALVELLDAARTTPGWKASPTPTHEMTIAQIFDELDQGEEMDAPDTLDVANAVAVVTGDHLDPTEQDR